MNQKASKASRTVVSIAAMFLMTSIALAIIGCGTNEEIVSTPDWSEVVVPPIELLSQYDLHDSYWIKDDVQEMMEDPYILCFAVSMTVFRKDVDRGYRYRSQEQYYNDIHLCQAEARNHAYDMYQHWKELNWR